jgi:cob(I)alamin adenosyltransferase
MWFYSGEGDEGKSSLMDGKRIDKNDSAFEFIGTLDELSANLGLAISFCENENLQQDLESIQKSLSSLMGLIACINLPQKSLSNELDELILCLEQRIQDYGKELQNPKHFIPSGKTTLGAALDICRTVARRAERRAVRFSMDYKDFNQKTLAFLNRLSSLLFLMRLFVENN